MAEQIPTIGRIVHYRLSADDATKINRRRTTGESIAGRMKQEVQLRDGTQAPVFGWPAGAQAHIGQSVSEGDVAPMMVTLVVMDTINGQVFLDGNDVFWATLRKEGPEPGQWFWPPRA